MLKPRSAVALMLAFAVLTAVGLTRLFKTDEPTSVTYFPPSPSRSISSLPPPTGLTLTAVTSTSAWFRWDPPAGQQPAGYCLLRENDWCWPIINASTTIAADAMLEPGKTYVYTVRSVDAAGLESVDSAKVTVRTKSDTAGSPTPPGPVRNLQLTNVSLAEFSIYWSPPESAGSSKLAGFIIVFDGIQYSVGPGMYSQTWPYVPGAKHVVRVIAKNSEGLLSEPAALDIVLPQP